MTEAGFGADLGAEKFLDIKCRFGNLKPDCAVIVCTGRALKHHGGGDLEKGMPNLMRHVNNIKNVFGLPCVVAMNRFPDDTEEELAAVIGACEGLGVKAVLSEVRAKGGEGGIALAEAVIEACEDSSGDFRFAYDLSGPIKDRINAVAVKIYGGVGVEYTENAEKSIEKLEELGFGNLPVCIAKTQYSFSDNKDLPGAPEGFTITVRDVKVSAGAGFIVVLTGNVMTMPGLPKVPAAENIDVSDDGVITGLF